MKFITIEHAHGEVTLELNTILSVCKENEESNPMFEQFFFVAHKQKYHLKEWQYIELLSLLKAC